MDLLNDIEEFINSELAVNNCLEVDNEDFHPESLFEDIDSISADFRPSNCSDQWCPVCGSDFAMTNPKRHSYYGAVVCVSCRGFFSRSVSSSNGGGKNIFKCKTQAGNCVIDSKSRKKIIWEK